MRAKLAAAVRLRVRLMARRGLQPVARCRRRTVATAAWIRMIGAAPTLAAKRAVNMPAIWARNVTPTVVVTARWMHGPAGRADHVGHHRLARRNDEGGDEAHGEAVDDEPLVTQHAQGDDRRKHERRNDRRDVAEDQQAACVDLIGDRAADEKQERRDQGERGLRQADHGSAAHAGRWSPDNQTSPSECRTRQTTRRPPRGTSGIAKRGGGGERA